MNRGERRGEQWSLSGPASTGEGLGGRKGRIIARVEHDSPGREVASAANYQPDMSVVILLADGVRPDPLASALDSSALPALSRLRAEGGLYTVPTCFPSVTGPAYTPFLMGRFPGPIGLPGLRWYDRSHVACGFPDYARSYVGYQMGMVDRDIAADAPTIFELCENGLGALNVISRGLPKRNRLGSLGPRSALRAARTHFSGNVRGWLEIDREIARGVARRIREQRPEFVFAALTGVDKVSHARGHDSPMVLEALQIVNDTAAEIRSDAERGGYWDQLSLWVVSDHGHSPVRQHEDLERFVEHLGHRVVAHPWIVGINPDVAVMVSTTPWRICTSTCAIENGVDGRRGRRSGVRLPRR